jgi:hypothetical protein
MQKIAAAPNTEWTDISLEQGLPKKKQHRESDEWWC